MRTRNKVTTIKCHGGLIAGGRIAIDLGDLNILTERGLLARAAQKRCPVFR